MSAASNLYLIALGSNQRHPKLGGPRQIIIQAFDALEMSDIDVFSVSQIMRSRPIGPSQREYANTAALLLSSLSPPEMLSRLQAIEVHFGRERRGQKWRSRTLDLDILLWSGGMWSQDRPFLSIPHPALQLRDFVLHPASRIARQMRDPLSGYTIGQLRSRLLRPKPLDQSAKPA